MMDLVMKRATLDDLDFLVEVRMEVIRTVFELPADEDMTEMEKANREYYIRAIPAGEHIACLAYVEGVFVGCGGACLHYQMPSPECVNGLCAYLMSIYTCPEFRGQGIGSKITTWLVERACESGATRIDLQATSSGRGVYERLGFIPLEDFMELPSDSSFFAQ